MLNASMLLFQEQMDQAYRVPRYFAPVFLVLLIGGALGWLVASIIGFKRARAFGSSTRWFASASVCLLLYHLHFLVLGLGMLNNDSDLVLSIGAFINLFVVVGAICAIIGFTRLTDPRP
jgi:Na+/phosphate symporter